MYYTALKHYIFFKKYAFISNIYKLVQLVSLPHNLLFNILSGFPIYIFYLIFIIIARGCFNCTNCRIVYALFCVLEKLAGSVQKQQLIYTRGCFFKKMEFWFLNNIKLTSNVSKFKSLLQIEPEIANFRSFKIMLNTQKSRFF